MKSHLHYAAVWQGLGIVFLLIVIVLSIIPADQPLGFDHADKWLHWLTWMLMMTWFGSAWPTTLMRFFIFLLAVGAALELLQGVLPWRHMDYFDLLANLAGLLTGITLLFTPLRRVLPWLDQVLAHRFNAPLS